MSQAKERRELREQQKNALLDNIPKDLNRPWEDPMPEPGERHIAQELKGPSVPDTQPSLITLSSEAYTRDTPDTLRARRRVPVSAEQLAMAVSKQRVLLSLCLPCTLKRPRTLSRLQERLLRAARVGP